MEDASVLYVIWMILNAAFVVFVMVIAPFVVLSIGSLIVHILAAAIKWVFGMKVS